MNRAGFSRNTSLPTLAAATTIVLWASAFVVIRHLGDVFSPGAMALLRMVTGVTALTVAWRVTTRRRRTDPTRPRKLTKRDLLPAILYGAAWFGGYTVLLNMSEQHVDAGTASLLVNFAPILVAAGAAVFLSERYTMRLALGTAVALSGIALIAFGPESAGAHADTIGIVFGLLAAALYAAGVLLQKVVLRTVDTVTATFIGAAAGLAVTLPFTPTAIAEVATASWTDLAAVIYLGVGPTAVAFTTWAYALSRTDAGTLASTTLAVPAIVVVMSWLVLAEVPTAVRIAGGTLALVGVAISRGLLGRRPKVPNPETTEDISPTRSSTPPETRAGAGDLDIPEHRHTRPAHIHRRPPWLGRPRSLVSKEIYTATSNP